MSNAFTKFLSGAVDSFLGNDQSQMRDYQHADRLFVRDTYARAPKIGSLFFLSFNISKEALSQPNIPASWRKNGPRSIGLLVKSVDLPKFQIETDVVNQYNRKTVIQKSIKYNPISITFHDDNSDLTNGLWTTYYHYYYGDDNQSSSIKDASNPAGTNTDKTTYLKKVQDKFLGKFKNKSSTEVPIKPPAKFLDTKYQSSDANNTINYYYGLGQNFSGGGENAPFFDSIDIYVLHQRQFTQFQLINPKITGWEHDSLENDGETKVLVNKATIAYESVHYNNGKINKGDSSHLFTASYYDNTRSPLSIGGKGSSSILGPGGLLAGAGDVFGALQSGDLLAAGLQGYTLAKNAKNLNGKTVLNELSGAAIGTLNNVAATGGTVATTFGGAATQGIIGGLGFDPNNNPATSAIASKLTGK